MRGRGLDGLLPVIKPLGVSSQYALKYLRDCCGLPASAKRSAVKTGHGGTLDPAARGVLVVAFGSATRQLGAYLNASTKEYIVTAQLGVETPTLDQASVPVKVSSAWRAVTKADVDAAVATLRAATTQVPPDFSAVHVGGQRAYQVARERLWLADRAAKTGVPVENLPPPIAMPARQAKVFAMEVRCFNPPFVTVAVTCGSGYYIRALVRDLGSLLGCGAVAVSLVRTRQGPFGIRDGLPYAQWTLPNVLAAIDRNQVLARISPSLEKYQ